MFSYKTINFWAKLYRGKCIFKSLHNRFRSSPITSLTMTWCWRVRGVLAPAALMALTRTKILVPGVSPVMVNLVFSVISLLDTTQSSAVDKENVNSLHWHFCGLWTALEPYKLCNSFDLTGLLDVTLCQIFAMNALSDGQTASQIPSPHTFTTK